MDIVGTSFIFLLSSSLAVYLLFSFLKFLQKICWKPIQMQKLMRSQGIKGPSYRIFYGNTKEMLMMTKESLSRPMEELSHQMLQRTQPHIFSWINKYGRNFVFWHGPKAHFVTIETEFIKEIMNNKDKSYPKNDTDEYLKKAIGDGLGTTEGEKWAKLRRLANRAFHSESLKNMTPAMIASVELMLERWKQYEGREIEVYEEFRFLTAEVLSRTAFGSSYRQGRDIFEMLEKLTLMVPRNIFKIKLPGLSRIYKTSDDIESEKLKNRIRESVIRIIKNKEKELVGRKVDEDSLEEDYLGLLLRANHETDDSYKLTIDEVVDDCKTFYVAGHETTRTLLAWAFVLLGIHTDWQEKARQEVLDIFGQQQPNSEGLSRMKTMNMIINETLRLYPPVTNLIRKANRDVRLGKFNLQANTIMRVPTMALHQDTQIWGADAHLFKPERFSEGIAKVTNNNTTAFIPFGFGPRNCVAKNFAINEVKIALTMILQRYSFSLSPTYIHAPYLVLTVRPQHGIQSQDYSWNSGFVLQSIGLSYFTCLSTPQDRTDLRRKAYTLFGIHHSNV